jgi:hypothetical protein
VYGTGARARHPRHACRVPVRARYTRTRSHLTVRQRLRDAIRRCVCAWVGAVRARRDPFGSCNVGGIPRAVCRRASEGACALPVPSCEARAVGLRCPGQPSFPPPYDCHYYLWHQRPIGNLTQTQGACIRKSGVLRRNRALDCAARRPPDPGAVGVQPIIDHCTNRCLACLAWSRCLDQAGRPGGRFSSYTCSAMETPGGIRAEQSAAIGVYAPRRIRPCGAGAGSSRG